MSKDTTLVFECLLHNHTQKEKHRELEMFIREGLRGRQIKIGTPVLITHPDIIRLRFSSLLGLDEDRTFGGFFHVNAPYAVKIHFYTNKKSRCDVFQQDEEQLFETTELPAEKLDCLWESLHFEKNTHNTLLSVITTMFRFSLAKVNSKIIGINRMVLLHGPPGTGKTSLSRALFNKVAIQNAHLSFSYLEINCQALFSKWFSESGKKIARLFAEIQSLSDDKRKVVFVLVDEIESLTLARSTALGGNEPSDSIRAVNTLLTQLDRLTEKNNVIVIGTTNLLHAIDDAFLSRVDISVEIEPPSHRAAYNILVSCIKELASCGLLALREKLAYFDSILAMNGFEYSPEHAKHSQSEQLYNIAKLASLVPLTGRTLRKAPFIAYTGIISRNDTPGCDALLEQLHRDMEQRKTEAQRVTK
ncbi:MAG: pachytene checkpoint protein 2 [Amphiamblys sp. WSBS2006]|nr:MAG: pachytene checkpoint protein 2 [Amphiamblys sp. WSBS2006]